MRFKDKVYLVTGGGSGIGKASCKRFAQEGGKVVVVDLNDQHGNETVQEITQARAKPFLPNVTLEIRIRSSRR